MEKDANGEEMDADDMTVNVMQAIPLRIWLNQT